MNSTRIRWTLFAVAAVTSAVFVSAWMHAAAADASSAVFTAPDSHMVVAINDRRVQAGLRPLQVDATLTASAVEWTSQMVAGSFLGHADLYDVQASAPGGHLKVGENVGRGSTVDSLVDAFMQSPAHRSNILDPAFTHIGVGVQVHLLTGKVYTTLRFAALPATLPPVPASPAQSASIDPDPTTAPPAATATPMATPAPPALSVPAATATAAPTATATPMAAPAPPARAIPTATAAPTATATPPSTPAPPALVIPSATATAAPTATASPTATATVAPTAIPTPTATVAAATKQLSAQSLADAAGQPRGSRLIAGSEAVAGSAPGDEASIADRGSRRDAD